MSKKLNVAVVGLAFGSCFGVIYRDHPDVASVGICDINAARAKRYSEETGIKKIYSDYDEILRDPEVDAIHLVTPIPLHEEQTVLALEAGKHCACTVPMALSLDGIKRITEAKRRSGKNYMMMETTLYTYQYFYVSRLIRDGVIGNIQLLRGSHYQDMANWPDYWLGLPPMYYGTHAIGPLVALSGSRICKTHCFGSGTMDSSMHSRYNNPYPVESAIFAFENGLKAEATRSLFETARAYQEGLFVYGSNASFEWGLRDHDLPTLTVTVPFDNKGWRGSDCKIEQINLPNFHESLPEPIQRYTVGNNFDPQNPHDSLKEGRGGGHHGSHPHLVHEFVRSIVENRKPWIDEILGGNITAAGVCAHESAMRGGEGVEVPLF